MLLITAMFVSGCQWFTWEDEQIIEGDKKSYSMDPTTLLKSLAEGNIDIFILQTTTPPPTPNLLPMPVTWRQSDYFSIAQAFHQFAFGQSLADWKLKNMTFTTSCENVPVGLQYGDFSFKKNEKDSLITRFIYVSPGENNIGYSEYLKKYYPELGIGSFLDLTQVKITAEQALQIAESAGGSKFRKEWGDDCRVFISIDSAGRYKGWEIWYSPNNSQNPRFSILVDETTGKYIILR